MQVSQSGTPNICDEGFTKPKPTEKIKMGAAVIAFSVGIFCIAKKVSCSAANALANMCCIEQLILPVLDNECLDKRARERFENVCKVCCVSRFFVETADKKAKIDGAIIWNGGDDAENYENKKWIICFQPNASCYEESFDWTERDPYRYSRKTGCNVVLFNYRGVMDSTGYPKSAEDLVDDGDAVFHMLLQKGVRSEDILIDGYSLGGGVGTQVRARHPEGPIVNRRSFSSIGNLAQAFIHQKFIKRNEKNKNDPNYKNKVGIIPRMISICIGKVIKTFLKASNWELDSLHAWSKIKGRKWIVTARKDSLMVGDGRLYTALKHREYEKEKINGKTFETLLKKANIKAALNHLKESEEQHSSLPNKALWKDHLCIVKAALALNSY